MKLAEKIVCLDYLNLLSISSRVLLHVLKLSQLTSHVSSTNRSLPTNNTLTCKKTEDNVTHIINIKQSSSSENMC